MTGSAVPKKVQTKARELLCAIPYAPTSAEALKRRERFAKAFRGTHPRAVEILERDWERMVAFYDFPQEHWKHLSTTNVVESPFASVRLRKVASKAVQENRERDGDDLAAAAGPGETLPQDRRTEPRGRGLSRRLFEDGVKLTKQNRRVAT